MERRREEWKGRFQAGRTRTRSSAAFHSEPLIRSLHRKGQEAVSSCIDDPTGRLHETASLGEKANLQSSDSAGEPLWLIVTPPFTVCT